MKPAEGFFLLGDRKQLSGPLPLRRNLSQRARENYNIWILSFYPCPADACRQRRALALKRGLVSKTVAPARGMNERKPRSGAASHQTAYTDNSNAGVFALRHA